MAPKLTQTIRRVALSPLTAIYAIGVVSRHFLYDLGLIKSQKASLPTFVIGNIHVGGTGKTPHASYFLGLFSKMLGGTEKVALLSRGYKRKSSGFIWVESDGNWENYGDEPALLKSIHTLNPVAVCENRLKGVEMIKEALPDVQVVILDDGLQHRALIPHFSMAIIDSHRPINEESLLPGGELRDLKSRLSTYDSIVISRTSKSRNEEIEAQGLKLDEGQSVFTSKMQNESVNPEGKPRVLAVCGIAHPERFMDGLVYNWSIVRRETYPDHFEYSEKEIKGWLASIRNEKLDGIVTTAKDAVKIRPLIADYPEIKLHTISIEVKWQNEEELKELVLGWLQFTIFEPPKTNK